MTPDESRIEAEKTLALLDRLPEVKAAPFFLTPLEARLENMPDKKSMTEVWSRALKPALFILLVAANLAVTAAYFSGSGSNGSRRETILSKMAPLYTSVVTGGSLFNLQKTEE